MANQSATDNPHSKTGQLTQTQFLMWTGQEMYPQTPLYNMAFSFEIKGQINPQRFQEAFQILINECDALRSVFHKREGLPAPELLDHLAYPLEVLDFRQEADKENVIESWLQQKSQIIFDPSARLFESALIQKEEALFIWYLNCHHLIMDAWGITLLFQYQAEIYQKLGEAISPIEMNIPRFADFVRIENEAQLQQEKSRDYWQAKAEQIPPPASLYGYINQVPKTASQRVSVSLGKEISVALRELAQRPGIRSWTRELSLFNIFASTLFIFLHRVSGQSRLSIGSPAHNRSQEAFKRTPGLLIELYPLLAEIEDQESFISLIKKVQVESNAFLRNAQLGSGASQLNRNIQVVLNYIHARFGDFAGMPTQTHWIHPDHMDPQHQLRLQVHDFNDQAEIQLHFDFNQDLFGPEVINNAPGHFLKILEQAIHKPEASIHTTPLLGDLEWKQHIKLSKPDTYSKDLFLDLFTKQVRQNPKALALSFEDHRICYEDLDHKSNQLAHFLKEKGLKPGDKVLLFQKRKPAFLFSILALMKLGATYIPLASDQPWSRLEHISKESNAKLILSHPPLLELAQKTGTSTLDIDKILLELAPYPTRAIEIQSKPDQLAYIIYTSGSTGKPKGVMISQASLANYLRAASELYLKSEKGHFAFFTALGFDLTVTSLFLPLISGGSLRIYEENDNGGDLAIFDVLEENKVHQLKLTPAHLELLRDKDLSQSQLKTLIVGGESLKSDLAQSIQQSFSKEIRIYNEYGPSEATVGCIVYAFKEAESLGGSVPIGQPFAACEAYILDPCLNPVPQGVKGELYLGGPGLARGYLNQAELSLEKFIDHPFAPEGKLYKTGDLVRLNPEGDMLFLGRQDDQVKIKGIRIELEEIEKAIGQHPSLQQATVLLKNTGQPSDNQAIQHCRKCGLPSNYPNARYDERGICHLCLSFEDYQQRARVYFKNMEALRDKIRLAKEKKTGKYDCLVLLSGGKDSTYALARMIELGAKVLAFTLDNGFISEGAKDNIRQVVKQLGVDHIFGESSAMNAIFVDSLRRHSNVCNGCFKTIYTLSTKIALDEGIPYVVTGLSRGQFFETRLSEELFWKKEVDVDKIDQTILEARKAYHRVDDAVKKHLDVSMFDNDEVFEKVEFLDFYRYCDVSLDDLLQYLDKTLAWVRPEDTGRSTNCLINDLGIYYHKKVKGYHNYAFPYSWDVRIGHKERDAALEELNDDIDEQAMQEMMQEIGFPLDEMPQPEEKQLWVYYKSNQALEASELRTFLKDFLPAALIPNHFVKMEAFPLNPNGKIDKKALLQESKAETLTSQKDYIAPRNEIETLLARIWQEVLNIPQIGVYDDFLEIGGTSLTAIRIMARLNEYLELELELNSIFKYPSIEQFSLYVEKILSQLLEEGNQ